ncbi:MAG TPA: hypothetical protein VE544_12145 [Nitrososphaeraceae archaeon]|nr:hypothetical protein [Nitrososphaeraceae archaeon]
MFKCSMDVRKRDYKIVNTFGFKGYRNIENIENTDNTDLESKIIIPHDL